MIINVSVKDYKLNYEFILEPKYNDFKKSLDSNGNHFFLNSNNCYFILPDSLNTSLLNNDLVALVGILIIYPFIGKRVKFNFKISKFLSDSFKKSGKNIEPIDESIIKISKKNSYSSLVFKSDIYSLASLLILPNKSKIICLNDLNDDKLKNEYIYNLLDDLRALNYNVNIMLTNLYQLIKPNGVSNLLVNSVANILLSQYLDITNISIPHLNNNINDLYNEIDLIKFNTNCIYNKHQKYDLTFEFWDNLFKSVNLKLNFNLLGITDITCHLIINNSQFKNLVNDCINKNDNKMCHSCLNCFKLNTINHIFKFKKISYKYLDEYYNLLNQKEKEKINSESQSSEYFIYYLYINYSDNFDHSIFNNINKDIIKNNNLHHSNLFFKINSSAFKYMDSNLLNFSLASLQDKIINK